MTGSYKLRFIGRVGLGCAKVVYPACSSLARICSVWNDRNVSPLPHFVCVFAHCTMSQRRRKRIGGEGRVRGLFSHVAILVNALIRPVGHLLLRSRGRRDMSKQSCLNVEQNPDKSTASNSQTFAHASPTLRLNLRDARIKAFSTLQMKTLC